MYRLTTFELFPVILHISLGVLRLCTAITQIMLFSLSLRTGDLPLDIQIKLLRILDQKRIMSEHPELVERFSELKKRYS